MKTLNPKRSIKPWVSGGLRQGDVVQLKSGRVQMTVEWQGLYVKDPVRCVWFDTDGHVQRGEFDRRALQLVSA